MTSFEIDVMVIAITAVVVFAGLTIHTTWSRRSGKLRPWRNFGNAKTFGEPNGENREVVREVHLRRLPHVSFFTGPVNGIFFGWMVTGFDVDHGYDRHRIRIHLARPCPRFDARYNGKRIYAKVSWRHSIRLLWWLLRSRDGLLQEEAM